MSARVSDSVVAFCSACERTEQDVEARVVVLRGAGPAFLAGGDVASFKENLADFSTQVAGLAGELHQGIFALRRAFARCSAHADFAERVMAFVEQRKAVFTHN